MATKKNLIIKKIKKWADGLEGTLAISQVYLFGSYAKGHPSKWSDIDVAVVSKNFKGVRFLDHKMLIPYLRNMPSTLEIHPFSKNDFNTKNLFVKEIVKSGIKIK